MKKALFFFSFCIAAAVAVSCNKVVENPESPAQVRLITIHATIPQGPESKVALTPDGNGLHLAWEEGDCIRVISENDSQVFTIQPGFTDHEATFTGPAVEGEIFDILYPGTYESADEPALGYPEPQIQDGNGNSDHLKYAVCLSGVNSYTEFSFSEDWAEEHGGSFFRPGAIKLVMTLPESASVLDKVSVNFDGSEFSLGLQNVDVSQSDQVLTAYVMLPWGDVLLSAGVPIEVKAYGSDNSTYGITFEPGSDVTLQAGHVSVFKFAKGVEEYPFAGGTGVDGDPYLIGNERHLVNMHSVLAADSNIYFKLIDDIDLDGIDWAPLNPASPYNKGVDFDGGGFTISNMVPVADGGYPSFVGVLFGSVRNVTFDGALINAGGNTAGVLAGYIGSGTYLGTCSNVIVQNSTVTGSKQRLGGLAGNASALSAPISGCSVINCTVVSSADRVGGLLGEANGNVSGCTVSNTTVSAESQRVGGLIGQAAKTHETVNCSAENVTVSGSINVGGLIGVGYGDVTNCTSSGIVASVNPSATDKTDIAIGGLIGYLENGTVSKCSSSVVINQTGNGRDIGGLVGKMLSSAVEKSFATGDVSGLHRNVGGLIGLITLTSGEARVTDCYCSGDVVANAYVGGLLGLHEKGKATIQNCYSTSSVSGRFALGGIAGVIGSTEFSLINSAAWNWSIEPELSGQANWSSGAVVGVTFPTCTLTDNYRNPMMEFTAYWVPDEDFNHPNVSPSSPLTDSNGVQMTDTGTDSSQPHHPQFPYHGLSAQGKTLSQVARGIGWDESVWNLGGSLPALR